MKIGIVCYPTFGGSGVVATELGKALAEKGHQIHFITYNQPVRLEELNDNLFYHEVIVSKYPLFDYTPYELVLTSKLVDVVKHEGLDLLHVHYAIPHASAAYMAKQILKREGINIPFITTLHGTDITLVGRDASFEPSITFAINESNAVTTVSESLRLDTLNHFKIDNTIQTIPNFICVDQYKVDRNEALRKRYAPNGEHLLIHISNFRPVKRVGDLVRIFKAVRDKVPAKMVLVGDGPERYNVEQMCRELGTCGDITFVGKVASVKELLSVSDVFLLTSETESFGLAALEAMASGVPVVSTNTGGIPEVNKHGYSGFLSNVGDTDDMAKNVLKVLESEESLATFRANALEQASTFDIREILPQYEALYKQAIESEKASV